MLEAKEVVKSFDGFRALDSATLTVPKGTVYGLVGPNGAGKSTIIRHFTGVYRPDSGKLLLEGAPIWENTDAKRRMVVIPDDWYYFPQASIAEMAKLYAGAYPSFSWERYEKMKQVFPLNDRQMLRRMSKGMQKQAAFWLTMCCMPPLRRNGPASRYGGRPPAARRVLRQASWHGPSLYRRWRPQRRQAGSLPERHRPCRSLSDRRCGPADSPRKRRRSQRFWRRCMNPALRPYRPDIASSSRKRCPC